MLPIIYMLWSIECFDLSVVVYGILFYCNLLNVLSYWWARRRMYGCVHACVYIVIVKYFPCIWAVFSSVSLSCWCFVVNCIECFYVNDEPESKFLYTETIKLYCIVLSSLVSDLRGHGPDSADNYISRDAGQSQARTVKLGNLRNSCHETVAARLIQYHYSNGKPRVSSCGCETTVGPLFKGYLQKQLSTSL